VPPCTTDCKCVLVSAVARMMRDRWRLVVDLGRRSTATIVRVPRRCGARRWLRRLPMAVAAAGSGVRNEWWQRGDGGGPAVAPTVKRRHTPGSRGREWSTTATVRAWRTSANFAVWPIVFCLRVCEWSLWWSRRRFGVCCGPAASTRGRCTTGCARLRAPCATAALAKSAIGTWTHAAAVVAVTLFAWAHD